MPIARYRKCSSCGNLIPFLQPRCNCGCVFSGKERVFKVCPACGSVLDDRLIRCDCGYLFIFRSFLDKQSVMVATHEQLQEAYNAGWNDASAEFASNNKSSEEKTKNDLDAAYRAGKLEADAKNEEEWLQFFERAGLMNTITGEPIRNRHDFNLWEVAYEEARQKLVFQQKPHRTDEEDVTQAAEKAANQKDDEEADAHEALIDQFVSDVVHAFSIALTSISRAISSFSDSDCFTLPRDCVRAEAGMAMIFMSDYVMFSEGLEMLRQPVQNELFTALFNDLVPYIHVYFFSSLSPSGLLNSRLDLFASLSQKELRPHGFWLPGKRNDSFHFLFSLLLGDLIYYPCFSGKGIYQKYEELPALSVGCFETLSFCQFFVHSVYSTCMTFSSFLRDEARSFAGDAQESEANHPHE